MSLRRYDLMTMTPHTCDSVYLRLATIAALIVVSLWTGLAIASPIDDRQAIVDTNTKIREGFAKQDIEQIISMHHVDVIKVFAWDNTQNGHQQMRQGLADLFDTHVLSFDGTAEEMVDLQIVNDTAIMIADFSIQGRPRTEGQSPFTFSGRTMIVYVREDESPTGWVTFREMLVPQK